MQVKMEVAILEKSVLVNLIQEAIRDYCGEVAINKEASLRIISDEFERLKELNLVSFYSVSSHVSLDAKEKKEGA